MATTTDRVVISYYHTAPRSMGTIAASQIIPRGSLAMNDAGAAKALTAPMPAGAFLLGWGDDYYANAGVAPAALPMTFKRGVICLKAKAGNVPTEANVGGKVRLVDNETCSTETISGNDASGTLHWITPEGFFVEV